MCVARDRVDNRQAAEAEHGGAGDRRSPSGRYREDESMGTNLESIDRQLLSHPGTSKALHEKWGWMVYWVGGKQFACEFTASPDAKAPHAGRHLLSCIRQHPHSRFLS